MKSHSLVNKQILKQELHTTPIAIIGMASIFPQARTLPEYWENIINKIDSIVDVPASRWKIDDYYDPNPAAPDKTYCKRGAFIPDIEFDPAEFGLPPNLLEVTDVSQLLSLVVAKECLEDAGYGDNREYSRENIGVILGVVGISSKLVIPLMARLQYPIWEKVLRSYGISAEDIQKIIEKIKLAYPNWEENAFPGSISNVIAGRIANRFDLGGTNCVVDAACASSLAAIRMAVSELIEGRADMMMTGGVDTDNSIGVFMSFSKTPAFSKSQNVRPFDKDSDGMMVGEGIGMVMLKRFTDAQHDGDKIYAVIKGIGTSSDGRFKSIYAPRAAGQAKALRRAYTEAGYSPATVGLIEAHGTGTMAGDPAEFQGLNEVFSADNPDKQYIAIGSVKSQIGHTKAAAGVASLIKASLALYHKVLPATINVKTPHPNLEIEKTPIYLNTETRPWIKPVKHPRRAGVSSFGFGGTNFHITLEENESEHSGAYRLQTTPRVVLLSASSPAELLAACQGWSAKLQGPQAVQDFIELVNASTTKHIQQNEARVGFVAANAQEALGQLSVAADLLKTKGDQESAEHPTGIYYRKSGLDPKGKLVAVFPGQGSQYVNMGRELAVCFPPIRQAFAEMDAQFDADGLPPFSRVVFPIPVFDSVQEDGQTENLTRTEYAQPAIGTLSVGLYKLLKQAGFGADFIAGHSFGELTALWAAGVYDDAAFYFLAKARGKAMAPPAGPNFDAGAMLAVKGDIDRLQADLQNYPEITLANWNAKNQVVLAGSKSAIATIQKALVEGGYSVVALPVSAAFHTALVGHAQKPFAEAVKKVKFNKPTIKVYSNTTGKMYNPDPDQIRQTLTEHILKPVLFKDEIEIIYAQGGSIFVEFGPKNVLTNLVKNILENKPHYAIALNSNAKKDSDRQFREAVTQLCVLGLDLRQYDPYASTFKPSVERKKSSISLMLGGGLYLTEKTRSAFETAIQQKDTLNIPNSAQTQPSASFRDTEPKPTPAGAQLQDISVTQNANSFGIENRIGQLQALQSETLKVHSQFLSNENEYARIFAQLTQQELNLLGGNSSQSALEQINTALQTLDHSMVQFHQHQVETLRVHEQYLRSQLELINGVMQLFGAPASQADLMPAVPATLSPTNVPATIPINAAVTVKPIEKPNPDGHLPTPLSEVALDEVKTSELIAEASAGAVSKQVVSPDSLAQVLVQVVSEKTGYPAEMLELGMDMEADLGIDSIKRVEILGAIQSQFPELPKADTTVLSEMRTLGQIVEYMTAAVHTVSIQSTPVNPTADIPVAPASVIGANTTSEPVLIENITRSLLEVVSEKTGYPTEMLDTGMDMEADLGIDSIKRVEILGAIQTRFPELSKVDTTALGELRTLSQIIESLTIHVPEVTPAITPKKITQPSPPESPVLPCRQVALKELPAPDQLVVSLPEGHICLLMDDGTALTPALASTLAKKGNKVIVMSLPDDLVSQKMALPQNVKRIQLDDLTDAGLQNTLATIQQTDGPVAVYIHLDPPVDANEIFSDAEKTIVKTTFLMAKHLKDNLTVAAQNKYAAFITITHLDGEFGLAKTGTVEPISGSLFGLVKTLKLEWDKVFCRAIELHPAIDAQTAALHIAEELYDPNRLISEVSYNPHGRFTLEVEQPSLEK